ncbi:MAG: PA4780 family RIO1-like protein kinase [Nitrosomonas sp.]|nr:PA4780 family RIO1-like protein kinase [Nitrosomonas sp.]
MKIPSRMEPLVEEGLVDSVVCQLMSGKEAMLYVVQCGEEYRCAKVYKEKQKRNFRQNSCYLEGREIRRYRRSRFMRSSNSFMKTIRDDAWHSVEVDTLGRLAAASVSAPKFYNFFEGVLLMELIVDSNGNVAPGLNQLKLTADQARVCHGFLVQQVVRMLCSGIVHGDLSGYNVLIGSMGPVIIDFPQAIHAAHNSSAEAILKRDVKNITTCLSRFAPELAYTDYGSEIWSLYQAGKLHLGVNLTGQIELRRKPVNLDGVLGAIDVAIKKEAAWQRYKNERWTSERVWQY